MVTSLRAMRIARPLSRRLDVQADLLGAACIAPVWWSGVNPFITPLSYVLSPVSAEGLRSRHRLSGFRLRLAISTSCDTV